MNRTATVGALGLCLVVVSAVLGHALAIGASSAPTFVVIDGDTLEHEGQPIQLAGIDAPELGQWCLDGDHLYACGSEAAYELKKVLALEPVTCAPSATDDGTYDCRTPSRPLSELMVEDGLAVARGDSLLAVAQDAARRVPLGIWRGRFVDPERWRNGVRLPEEAADHEACPVLVVSQAGVTGYVVPTDAAYPRWEQDPESVERRLCSDEAARADGYPHIATGDVEAPVPPEETAISARH